MKKLFVLAAVLLVSACGIKPTGVVPAGPAPTLRNSTGSGRGAEVILYFVAGGRVTPVGRSSRGPVDVSTALSLLLAGPTYAEQSEGLETFLPTESGQVALNPGSPTVLRFTFALHELKPAAVNQLVCTASAALAANGAYVGGDGLTLTGTDGELPAQTCQAN